MSGAGLPACHGIHALYIVDCGAGRVASWQLNAYFQSDFAPFGGAGTLGKRIYNEGTGMSEWSEERLFALVMVVGFTIATVVGAVCLHVAIVVYNRLSGGAASLRSVPQPMFRKTLTIALVTAVANLVANVAIAFILSRGASVVSLAQVSGFTQLSYFPMCLLVMAPMLMAMLPTTIGRAMLVTFCYMAIMMLVGFALQFVISVIFFVYMISFGGGH